ncbi:hypothetical protein [Chryseobacterium chendengshani]|uniref:hypothetical protein n=1 Tax=Chryseobacterium sp. LJ756 TaxID=2864113 RepID=UPI001C63CAFC|nr:hypothetical protein [Chryseobacterium sp. LJ756]MBW7674232.1 hypothetical protein [Chryseobacterium sp. LJ756]
MKTFIPIFSIAMASVLLQNCHERDEEIISNHNQSDEIKKSLMKQGDSTKSAGEITDQDPPVRDGDNWRIVTDN